YMGVHPGLRGTTYVPGSALEQTGSALGGSRSGTGSTSARAVSYVAEWKPPPSAEQTARGRFVETDWHPKRLASTLPRGESAAPRSRPAPAGISWQPEPCCVAVSRRGAPQAAPLLGSHRRKVG